jgi:hypothetical protein
MWGLGFTGNNTSEASSGPCLLENFTSVSREPRQGIVKG